MADLCVAVSWCFEYEDHLRQLLSVWQLYILSSSTLRKSERVNQYIDPCMVQNYGEEPVPSKPTFDRPASQPYSWPHPHAR